MPPRNQKTRKATAVLAVPDSTDGAVSDGDDAHEASGNDRLLMRRWIEQEADTGSMTGLQWYDKSQNLVKISWKHGSKSGWSEQDCEVFINWAKHTGRYAPGGNHKRWKANFRCALNSLSDCEEVKTLRGPPGAGEAFKVYRLKTETTKKRRTKGSSESSLSSRRLSRCSSSSAASVYSSQRSVDSVTSNPSTVVSPTVLHGDQMSLPEPPLPVSTVGDLGNGVSVEPVINNWLYNVEPGVPLGHTTFHIAYPSQDQPNGTVELSTVFAAAAAAEQTNTSKVPLPLFVESLSPDDYDELVGHSEEIVNSTGSVNNNESASALFPSSEEMMFAIEQISKIVQFNQNVVTATSPMPEFTPSEIVEYSQELYCTDQ